MTRRAGNARRLLAAAALCAVVASSCATYEKVPAPASFRVNVPDFYVGKPEADVVAEWGKPAKIERDADGLKILIYTRRTSDELPEWKDKVRVASDPFASRTDPVDVRVRTVERTDVLAKFFLDADQRVRRTWFSSELLDKGVPAPPQQKK